MFMAYHYRTNWLLSANLKDNLQERTNEGNAEPVVNADGALPSPPVSDRAPMALLPPFLEHTWEVIRSPGSGCTANDTGCRGVVFLPTGRTTLGCYSRFRAPCAKAEARHERAPILCLVSSRSTLYPSVLHTLLLSLPQ